MRRVTLVRTVASVYALSTLVGFAPGARAQDNSAAVEQLFSDGKKLMASGNVAEACPKFLASYNLEHRVGTLLNLADCYEQNKQYASAWARFIEARTLATRGGQNERADYAATHAAALDTRRSMLVISVPQPQAGLVIKRDGVVVDPAVYGVEVPVDGGEHAVEASAPGKSAVSESIVVAAEHDTKTYVLPQLVDTAVLPASAPDAQASGSKPTGRLVASIAVAGAGVVLVGVGAYFGATAISKNNESASYCGVNGQKDDCYGKGIGLRGDAVTDATISTVLIGVGVAAIAGGAVLWLTAPAASAPAVGFDGRMLQLRGTF
jgi:hypothetical protein